MIVIYESRESSSFMELLSLIVSDVIDPQLLKKQVVSFSLVAFVLTSASMIILLLLLISQCVAARRKH